MKFEGIEIYGFKSFADRVTIDFQNGLTGIVGPNGCGKSNVVDAIRWVLGEQSAKILRGKTMQDVIFNGTARRKSLSFCEVDLKFNNEGPNRIFKNLEFDKVIISRKLYRNGNSEYLINGTNAHLRDIRAMIRETGLGREGYSIIGQGKIDEIINSKPEGRRAIFEDAAGVLSSKLAKKEAEANLADYQIKKDQYISLLQEVERSVNRLAKESETAKKAVEIVNRLTYLEANSYVFQKENNGVQKEKIKSKIEGIKEQIESLTKENQKYIDRFTELTEEQKSLDVQLGQIRDEKTKLAVKEESVRGAGNTLLATQEGLLNTKEDYSNRLKDLETENDANNALIRDLIAQKSMTIEERDDLQKEYNAAIKIQSQLMGDILSREQEIELQTKEVTDLIKTLGDIKGDLGKINAQKVAVLDRIADLVEEIASLENQLSEHEKNRDAHESIYQKSKKEKERLDNTVSELLNTFHELRAELEEIRNEAQELQSDISAEKARVAILEDYVNQHSAFSGAVQRLLQAADVDSSISSKILGVVANIVKVEEKYQVAIETALGASIQHIVVEDEEDGKFLIRYLQSRNLGRVTFLPISSFKTRELDPVYMPILKERGCLGIASKLISYPSKFASIMSGLLGSTIICDNIDNAVNIARKYSYGVKIVTLDGEVLNTSGSMSGGSTKSGVSILSQEKQLETLQTELKKHEERFNELKRIFKEKNEEYIDIDEQLKEYESNAKIANDNYIRENAIYEAIVSNIIDVQERLEKAKEKKLEQEEKIEIINKALEKIDKQNQDLRGNTSSIDGEAKKNREEFNQKKEEKAKIDARITEIKISLEGLRVKLNQIETDLNQAEEKKKIIKSNIDDCRNILATNDFKLKATTSNISKNVLSEEDKKRLKEIDAVIKKYDERKLEVVEEIRKNDEKRTDISNKLISLNTQKTNHENSLARMDERMNALEIRIREDYDLDYEKALLYKDDEFDFESAQTEIKSLKGQRSQLGPVNYNAVEEYAKEKERFESLDKEYQDLIIAENDLKGVIANLSQEILEKFTVEFNKINEHFKEIFKEVFGGGSGELRIKEPEEGQDPLDAGVDVYAQPPGKKVALLMQLSGGEKALTAIAILFAILRLRPMPFCVLDEVEAALDEGNVGVYAKYLKKFSKETQFIVITHRKPTMKLADILYGVAMQEQGVSKVYYASIEEAIKHSSEIPERVE